MSALPIAADALHAQATELPQTASLAMYDWPELQDANDALWSAIADRLAARGVAGAPARLTRPDNLDAHWTSPALLLAQTCGYPLVTKLRHRVQLLATPSYRGEGCEGPFRRSAIVVRANSPACRLAELQGARCALNDPASDSGMNLLRAAVAPLAAGQAFFSRVTVTGSHLASAEAVASGAAHLAALDAVSLAHLRRLKPHLARRLRVLQWTARTPGLPLVTAANTDPATVLALKAALGEVAGDPRLADAREMLLLQGFSPLPANYYRMTLHLEESARALGYPELR